ncbi:class I SAM-dependent methyltransferase [Verrucomicrobiota bacterium sgz303538]
MKNIIREVGAKSVLDIGTGNGANLREWSKVADLVVGMEPDEGGVRRAAASNPETRTYKAGVYDDPSVLDKHDFDLAISVEVVEHLLDPHALPRFAAQVVRPGGWLAVTTPYHGYLKNLALSLSNKWDRHHLPLWTGGHIKFWSRNTLAELLRRNGFVPEKFRGCGRIPYLWKSMIWLARKA